MMKWYRTDIGATILILLTGILLFVPLLGNCPLFDWDEINFAECAREMVVTDNYREVQLNFHPFWEKPPFFIWLQAASMNIFGVNEFAARFPNALCGIITLLVLYFAGKSLNNQRFGLLWVLVYIGTLLPHFYFRSGIMDPWFNLFMFLSVYCLLLHTNNPVGKRAGWQAAGAGFFLGMAVLTKGPAALLLVVLTVAVVFVLGRFRAISSFKFMLLFFAVFLLTGGSWFIIEALNGNTKVIQEFVTYQVRLFETKDSDHGGFLLYHFVILLLGCFPSSIFLIAAHRRSLNDTLFQKHAKRWMLSLFWVVLIVFTIVQTKIVHYSSLCYFPLTYLAAYTLQKLISREWIWKAWMKWTFLICGTLLGLAFLLVGCVGFLKPFLLKPGLIADRFAVENLKAPVQWQGWEWGLGLVFVAVIWWYSRAMSKGNVKRTFTFYGFSAGMILLFINVLTPKVEQYSQDAAIVFYKAIADKNFYVETYGFKSYAYLFYGNKQPAQNTNPDLQAYVAKRSAEEEKLGEAVFRSYNRYTMEWMIAAGKLDRPACIVAKITSAEEVEKYYPEMKRLYSSNGFVFYYRMPKPADISSF